MSQIDAPAPPSTPAGAGAPPASETDRAASSTKLPIERQRQIFRLALKNGSVDVSELAGRFDVTTETIRRDLSDLQDRNLVRRVHGGAVPVEQRTHEPMIDVRSSLNPEEKRSIAQLACSEIPHGGTVVIDSGSTGLSLAEVVPTDTAAHFTTNSLVGALTLARRGITELSVLGGDVRTNTFAMVDAQTVDAVRSMRVDVLFISCDGLSFSRGLTTPYRAEFHLKRAMIESARRVVALVDHSKFGNDQTFSFASLPEIDVLITDGRATDDEIDLLAESGIDVRRS